MVLAKVVTLTPENRLGLVAMKSLSAAWGTQKSEAASLAMDSLSVWDSSFMVVSMESGVTYLTSSPFASALSTWSISCRRTNQKLSIRSKRMVMAITGVSSSQ